MLQSLLVYSLMCFSLFFLPQVSTQISKDGYINTIYSDKYYIGVFCALLIFAFFSGVRWDVGVDHLSYLKNYEQMAIINNVFREDMEIGFVHFMRIFSTNGMHFSVFFGTIAFIQLGSTYLAFNTEKYIVPFLGLLIMCSGDYFSWMNGIRQNIVSTLFLPAIPYFILRKKTIHFVLFIYFCSLFHKSAFFLMIFYPLAYLKLEDIYLNRKIQYILLFGAIVLSSMNLWQILVQEIDPLLALMGYEERFDVDEIVENTRSQNFGPRKIILLLLDSIIIYFSKDLRNAFSSKLFGFSYILFILFYVTSPLFNNSAVVSRVILYYYVFRAIVASYLLFYLFRINNQVKNVRLGCIVVFLFILHLMIQIYTDKGGHTSCILYNFFWDKLY